MRSALINNLFYENCMPHFWNIWTKLSHKSEIVHMYGKTSAELGAMVDSAIATLPPSMSGCHDYIKDLDPFLFFSFLFFSFLFFSFLFFSFLFFSLPLSSSPFYSFSLSSSCCPFIISVNLPPPLRSFRAVQLHTTTPCSCALKAVCLHPWLHLCTHVCYRQCNLLL